MRRDGALVLAAALAVMVAYMLAQPLVGRRYQAEMLLPPAAMAAVVLPLGAAAWVGARWARPAGVAAGLGWAAFMGWVALTTLAVLPGASHPALVWDAIVAMAQASLGLGAAFVFARRGG